MEIKLNKYIDHTLLKPEATKQDIINLCNQAIQYDFATVCVNTCWTSLCKELLKNSNVGITNVVGFPLGACLTEVKVFETKNTWNFFVIRQLESKPTNRGKVTLRHF